MDKSKDTSGSDETLTSGKGVKEEAVSDVSYGKDFVEKIKKEKDNHKSAREAAEAELKRFKDEELKAKEQYKSLYEQTQKELEEKKSELNAKDQMINQGKLNSAINAELLRAGIDPTKIEIAKKLINKDSVLLDKDTQVVIGAAEAVQAFVKEHSDLNLFGNKGKANHQAGATQSVGSADWQKAKKPEDLIAQYKQAKGLK